MKAYLILILVLGVFIRFNPTTSFNKSNVRTETDMQDKSTHEGPFGKADWAKMFKPGTPLLEIFIRGSVTYLSLFFLLRIVLKRETGTLGMTDLLVLVLLADAAQNAMADNYQSLTDGILLVATIIGWAVLLDALGFYFPKFQKFIHPPALLLIKDGKIIKKNLRREFLTEDELMSQVREQGINAVEEVKEAYIEMDGRISVIPFSDKGKQPNKKRTF